MVENGTATTQITVNKAGTFKLNASGALLKPGTSNPITVGAGSPASIMVSAPFTATVNKAVNVTITALDQGGNHGSLNGTVTVTCTNGTLESGPVTVTLNGGTDNVTVSVANAGQVTLLASGNTSNGPISGSSGVIIVGSSASGNLAGNIVASGGTACRNRSRIRPS
jgi:hypothetical protein